MKLKTFLNEDNTDLNVKRIVDKCLQDIAHIYAKFSGEPSLQKAILGLFKDIEKAQRVYNKKVF